MDERQIEIATRIANAKRPSAKMITQVEGKELVNSWIPRAGGLNVTHPSGKWKYKSREEAIIASRETIENARRVVGCPHPAVESPTNE